MLHRVARKMLLSPVRSIFLKLTSAEALTQQRRVQQRIEPNALHALRAHGVHDFAVQEPAAATPGADVCLKFCAMNLENLFECHEVL